MFQCYPVRDKIIEHTILVINSINKSSKELEKTKKNNFQHDDVLDAFMTSLDIYYNKKPNKNQEKNNKFFYNRMKELKVPLKITHKRLVNEYLLDGIKIEGDKEGITRHYNFRACKDVNSLYLAHEENISGIIILADTRDIITGSFNLSILQDALSSYVHNYNEKYKDDDKMYAATPVLIVKVAFHPDNRKKFYVQDDNRYFTEMTYTIDKDCSTLISIPSSEKRFSTRDIYKKLRILQLEAKLKFINIYWEPFIYQNNTNCSAIKTNKDRLKSMINSMISHIQK